MRKPFIAGNWKMNMNSTSAVALVSGLVKELVDVDTVDVAVCPPFVYLQSVAAALSASNIALVHKMFILKKRCFTGEISCGMLKDVSCTYAIIGHSERRHVMGETDALINKKISAAIKGGLLPIFCVGELLEERENGTTNEVVARQIKNGLEGICAESVQAVTVAYEPVWAIGTGLTATPEQAQEVHAMIRGLLAELYGDAIAQLIRIQYGGSAKPGNTAELMAQPDVDGLLVGGASLKVEDFAAMVKTVA